jgi:MFS family permease
MEMVEKFKNLHYGWIIVAAGFIIMGAGLGIVYNVSSLFVNPISEELGFSRSQANAFFTIRAICQVIAFLLAKKIYQKIRIRRLMQVVTVTLILSFFSYSLMNDNVLIFYLITFVSSMSVSLLTILPLSIIISNWFAEKRGFAVGIAFMGSGIGGMIFNALTGQWLVSLGWRATYQVLSLIIAVLIIPMTFFVIRTEPIEKGLKPYGYKEKKQVNGKFLEESGLTFKEVIVSTRFWLISVSSILLMLGINGIMAMTGPHLRDLGYSVGFSANIVALSMGALAIGKVVVGRLFDTIGSRGAITASSVAAILGLIGLLFAEYNIALAAIIVGTGIGAAYGSIANTMIAVDLYGRKDYNAVFGILSAVGTTGAIVGPIIIGNIYDITGSYNAALKIAIICGIIAVTLFQFTLKKPYPKDQIA